MARYTGPKCKIARRERMDLEHTKKPLDKKCNMKTVPGMHGLPKRLVGFGAQFRAKQALKRRYGLMEKQFFNYFKLSNKATGNTGLKLLQFLESRLDNVVFRLGFASTRAQARQFVSHGLVQVNNRRCNIPSVILKPGDVISIKDTAKGYAYIQQAVQESRNKPGCSWITVDTETLQGIFLQAPDRENLSPDLNEQLVVELYSK